MIGSQVSKKCTVSHLKGKRSSATSSGMAQIAELLETGFSLGSMVMIYLSKRLRAQRHSNCASSSRRFAFVLSLQAADERAGEEASCRMSSSVRGVVHKETGGKV